MTIVMQASSIFRAKTGRAIPLAGALMLLSVGGARADPVYDVCLKPAVTNYDFDVCGAAYLKRADAVLNVAWRLAFSRATGRTKADLLTEQRAWVAFKDKSCLLWANGENGREGQVLSFPACRGEVIEQRTRALANISRDLGPQ